MPDDDETIVSAQHTTQFGGEANLAADTVIDGRFIINRLIGRGGMCSVYEAKHKQLKRRVAIKLLHLASVASVDAVARFQREAILASDVKHPNIIEIYGFGMWESRPYIAMEYLEGRTLAEIVDQDGTMQEARAQNIFKQICNALQCAHDHAIVHRDLKPSNVMVCADDRAKLVDFGIARLLPESSEEVQKLTQTGQVLGSFFYMSPEQCMGKPVDGRSDLYSFGCLMYKVLTGKPPFSGDNPFGIMGQHLGAPPPAMAGASARFEAIAKWCLRKEPGERPQSASELLAVLEGEDLKATVPVFSPEVTKRNQAKAAKSRLAVGAAIFAFVATIGTGAYFLLSNQHGGDAGNPFIEGERRNAALVERMEKAGETKSWKYFTAIYDTAHAMQHNGNMIEAISWFKRLASDNPRVPPYYQTLATLHLAECCVALGTEKYDTADRHFQRALELSEPIEVAMGQQVRLEYANFLLHEHPRSHPADAAEDAALARKLLTEVATGHIFTPPEAQRREEAKKILADLDRSEK